MSAPEAVVSDDDIDASVDAEIRKCLDLAAPKSFFLFAGAGSGKTRSLVSALQYMRDTFGETLRLRGQRVAVITYTNAASEEIKKRLAFDPTIDVSTIHSFAWSLINGLNRDIREWLRKDIAEDIAQLQKEEDRGKKGSGASASRISKIAAKTKRLQNLDYVKRFVYSPTGENRGRDSLNHAEVIKLTSYFLKTRPTMKSILVGRYPILLIDESQDTNKDLIDALFAVQTQHKQSFVLGLFGDMMQRIYSDGKDGLGNDLPTDWATPVKKMNHRCPKRVVTLINKVRSATDKQEQRPRSDSVKGCVRLFILPSDTDDKPAAEQKIALHMANVTSDEKWKDLELCKILTLEHRMAARRMGFLKLFESLYEVESWRTNLLDGSLPCVRFFSDEVLPLVKASLDGDRFAIARIVKNLSPLLSPDNLRKAGDQHSQLKLASAAIDHLIALFKDGADPSLADVLRSVASNKLFSIPESLLPNVSGEKVTDSEALDADTSDVDCQRERAVAIEKFLRAPFSQVERFASYVSGKAHFDTHQGVKGLEFDRVMVIMDDNEARGHMFNYKNLFEGQKIENESVERVKSVERVRRLFYVTCSRARKSLALVAYTKSPDRVHKFVTEEGWFVADEIVMGSSG